MSFSYSIANVNELHVWNTYAAASVTPDSGKQLVQNRILLVHFACDVVLI